MPSNEIREKKAKQRRRMMVSLSLIIIGLVMVITAAIMEASNYPWGVLFGTATQNADVIPDPSPIVLDEEDKNVIITAETPAADLPAADASAANTAETDTPVSDAAAENVASASVGADLPGNEEDTEKAPVISKFVVIGTLKIPVLGVSQNLLEGAGKQMKYGVGHLPSTTQPGQKGNCAVSGHRPYPFRYLDQLKTGDSIVIKTGGVTYTYAVFDSFDVLPSEVWVLNNVPGEDYTLTVITCTPYMVSSHRLIIRGRLIDIDGKTPQEYYGDVPADVTSPDVIPTESAQPGNTDTSAVPSVITITEETASPSDAAADTTTDIPPSASDSTDSLPASP